MDTVQEWTVRQMTDKEIIKALDYCKDCYANINIDIIDLIDRQQAEIEKLKIENRILSQKRANIFEILAAFEKGEAKGRVDAVKEFVESLCKDRVFNDPVVIAAKSRIKRNGR